MQHAWDKKARALSFLSDISANYPDFVFVNILKDGLQVSTIIEINNLYIQNVLLLYLK